MDYQALSMLVPKPVESWTLVEIRKWLHFIDMQRFLPLFENNNFNGELLTKTTVKTLMMMGINSNIQQKKFMAWIERGFSGFNDYLFNSNMDKQNICPNLQQRIVTTQKVNKKVAVFNKQPAITEQTQSCKMKISNYEGPQTVNYIANRKGLRIGRTPKCQIQCLQVTVETDHAKIYMQNDCFYICDIGTQSGTFIKVHHKIELLQSMLVELGSYLFLVKQTLSHSKQINVDCINIISGMKEELTIDLNQKPCFYFGRKSSNDFTRDDQHMSGTHARIYFENGKFILEDLDSTNGTWLRLSQPKKQSKGHKLENGTIFKIGNTITYICSKIEESTKMQIEDNSHICVVCNKGEKNILFLPCKHTITCENCSLQHTHCSLCNHQIEQKVRIFV